jgi:hypothetical protein
MDLWTFGSWTRWVVILCIYVVDLVRFLVCVCHLIDCLIAVLFHLSYVVCAAAIRVTQSGIYICMSGIRLHSLYACLPALHSDRIYR